MGIVGGGQLAWMLAQAAQELGVELHVQTPSRDDPAAGLASSVELAAVDDAAATARLAGRCQAISFENEWVPLEALAPLAAAGACFLPSLQALAPLVSKREQRRLLDHLHLPCPRWCPLEAALPPLPPLGEGVHPSGDPPAGATGSSTVPRRRATDHPAATRAMAAEATAPAHASGEPHPAALLPPAPAHLPEGFHFPVMAKASRGGYDGKGTRPIHDLAALQQLLNHVDPAAWILEEMVAFELELALVASRDRHGEVRCFPLVQTHQHHQVCDWVLFPAPVDQRVEALARNVAASLLTALDYVGVLSVEFFYGPHGLQVNELAPRTHNSGHVTIEACRSSQFEQQLRIVAGLPAAGTEAVVPGALMVNLLGFEESDADYAEQRQALANLPGAHLHWYGKRGAKPGRKLGHLTLLLDGATAERRAEQREERLTEVRTLWPLPSLRDTPPT